MRILRVLRQQGREVAGRTYRTWKRPARIADRKITDADVEDKVRDLAWTFNEFTGRRPDDSGGPVRAAEAPPPAHGLAGTSRGAVERAMRALRVSFGRKSGGYPHDPDHMEATAAHQRTCHVLSGSDGTTG
ncbi:hypothetical protein [Promicromonospora iranensis]|uniref:Transposase n=1 Tax=Promicromonospora iranensis TaxID=1105144 RepID=A0ABU2CSU5_9MICO|nr:hypothetical protein [Promicromonospora iranensis]MDR7384402.1 hypothetical protein [Promicromonospora iranensis]